MSENFGLTLTLKPLYKDIGPSADTMSDLKLALFSLAEPDDVAISFNSDELDTSGKVTLAFNTEADAESVRQKIKQDRLFTTHFDIPDKASELDH